MKKIILGTTITVISIGIALSVGYLATSRCNANASPLLQQSSKHQDMVKSLSSLTSSPLRASTQMRLKASPEDVFEYLSSEESLPLWMPGLESVTYNHSDSVLVGILGEGSQRKMIFGGQKETETIVKFEQPNVIAYKIIEGVPLKNHLATMTVEGDAEESVLTWNQYFDLQRTSVYGWLMPFMVRRFLDDAQANLTDKFGGKSIATCKRAFF
ncbi:MAG: SRPBCC family protein [Cyanobacteria bacterium P01_F01_bin.116]